MTSPFELKETSVSGENAQGEAFRAIPVHMDRFQVAFEVHPGTSLLKSSEAIQNFKIILHNRTLYAGTAVVAHAVDQGSSVLCAATLQEEGWHDVEFETLQGKPEGIQQAFTSFFEECQKIYRIDPSYKLLAADLQILFTELRLWLEQVELGIRASPSADRARLEKDLADQLQPAIFAPIDHVFEKLEGLASRLEEPLRPAHRAYIKRQLHPHILCSPFAFRTVHKPLGYAGDYEMVNMLLRDPHEGGTLYAKMLNRWFIKQPPAEAHRNRITYLADMLIRETARCRMGTHPHPARIYNLGCGPAQEIQRFLATSETSHDAHFTLLDFNEETLNFAHHLLGQLQRQHQRRTVLQFQRKAVAQVLKAKSKSIVGSPENLYDVVYCAGLFDYLTDAVSQQLMNYFYSLLAPGGLLVVTNVDVSNPIKHWLGDVLEWHLIYRNGETMRRLKPDAASPDQVKVEADITGVNLFMEVRKPTS